MRKKMPLTKLYCKFYDIIYILESMLYKNEGLLLTLWFDKKILIPGLLTLFCNAFNSIFW